MMHFRFKIGRFTVKNGEIYIPMLLLVFSWLAACDSSSVKSNNLELTLQKTINLDTNQWIKYINHTERYEIRYPRNWNFDSPSRQADFAITYNDSSRKENLFIDDRLFLTRYILEDSSLVNMANYKVDTEQKVKRYVPNCQILSSEIIPLNNGEAYQIVYSGNRRGSVFHRSYITNELYQWRELHFIRPEDSIIFCLGLEAKKETFEYLEEMAGMYFNSFHFTK